VVIAQGELVPPGCLGARRHLLKTDHDKSTYQLSLPETSLRFSQASYLQLPFASLFLPEKLQVQVTTG